MRHFAPGQRVAVWSCGEHGSTVNFGVARLGTVVRLLGREGGGAWVHLDERLTGECAVTHPFPADDPGGRGTAVLAYPEDCERPVVDRRPVHYVRHGSPGVVACRPRATAESCALFRWSHLAGLVTCKRCLATMAKGAKVPA